MCGCYQYSCCSRWTPSAQWRCSMDWWPLDGRAVWPESKQRWRVSGWWEEKNELWRRAHTDKYCTVIDLNGKWEVFGEYIEIRKHFCCFVSVEFNQKLISCKFSYHWGHRGDVLINISGNPGGLMTCRGSSPWLDTYYTQWIFKAVFDILWFSAKDEHTWQCTEAVETAFTENNDQQWKKWKTK